MAGIMYGIGVGPGDPELMTLKAVKRIRDLKVIAIPHKNKAQCTAYQIARQAVPEIEEKICLHLHMPMTKDENELKKSHEKAASAVMEYLDKGEDVGFITLGDVSIYSTFTYLWERLWKEGYATRLESGIPSFCAVAARLGIPLVSGAEELHIIPASYQIKDALKLSGVKVLMKAGRQMGAVKEELRKYGASAVMVENCGMPDERIYGTLEEIPEDAGYYSLVIVR
ncbi:precorrin-2 C(20)-methyltransferase [Lacrimispora saccharolytica]|uniref:Precorrin-2 C20-methyltransferase n=1 Tax=Lacrimispora saccharolytica (strain ATCC 35040 / DSM 2544 / NRCC 2533 / WM1) TaxID=610130 RepID=D9R4B7_LACSW|nr:precorrin-2 C(20)-methyltransferase [Lacrimispora saccharolytica]ADL04987.1 precorrin-2 C20-methyltransferase [[Clostridium] saccharolyticum WM1]QRV20811.1 precorrin-2 C(20)-methyltransferase [Lacrimispora saccharolytica]